MQVASDSDGVRRHNRAKVLGTLRRIGATSRTRLAAESGLSNASITAISQDLLAQQIIIEREAASGGGRVRGRPSVLVELNRAAGSIILVELAVGRGRFSLVDYGGILIDRVELDLAADLFDREPALPLLVGQLQRLLGRNALGHGGLLHLAISVQGMLYRHGRALSWSPIAHLADVPLADGLAEALGVPVSLHKRGRLLAEGVRWLFPDLQEASFATVFIGSTIAMGLTLHGSIIGRGEDGATEFGHMTHIADGALCRCGMRGCIEAYAADYAVLRNAYSVPEGASPAASVPAAQYDALIQRAESGDRDAGRAFNQAGRAIGYGLARTMALFDPSQILMVGPGARAHHLMAGEIEAAIAASLVGRIGGLPTFRTHLDANEPVFRGLMMKTLIDLDRRHFANLAPVQKRA